MRYKAIIFDLFGTLVKNLLSHQYREMLVEITDILLIEQDRFIDFWLAYSDDRMTGKMSNADCLSLICQETGLKPAEETFRHCLDDFTDQVRFRLEPPSVTLVTLVDLLKKGYEIGLISNCSDEVSFLWDNLPLSASIQYPIFSSSVGLKKPDPRIYHLAAGKMDAKPQECLFVDDSIEYLGGAMMAGMTGVLIQDRTLDSSHSNTDDWDGNTISSIRGLEILLDCM